MRVLCSSRKPMRKTPVSGFPELFSPSVMREREELLRCVTDVTLPLLWERHIGLFDGTIKEELCFVCLYCRQGSP